MERTTPKTERAITTTGAGIEPNQKVQLKPKSVKGIELER
jgi:hypothetical protein